LNSTLLMALAQLAGFAAGMVMAMRQTEPIATPSQPERSRGHAAFGAGVLIWAAFTVVLSHQQWPHLPVLLAATAIAGLIYLPLSTMSADEDDDSPVSYFAWLKATFAMGMCLASLAGLAAVLIHRA
jgi:hypothetical protein